MALGPWFATDTGVRLPSALASPAGIGVAVWLTQRLHLPGVVLVAALGVLCSLSVWYAQEARSVALAGSTLLVCTACLAILAGARDRAPRAGPLGYLGRVQHRHGYRRPRSTCTTTRCPCCSSSTAGPWPS